MGFRKFIHSLLIGALLVFVCGALPAAAQTLLVVPFENTSGNSDLEWVGESFAESLSERLDGFDYVVVPREERLSGLERLGLPPTPTLTRASLYRLGEVVGARWIVLGRFRVAADVLLAEAQVLDAERLTLSGGFEERGPFARLLEVQTRLAWKILHHLDPDFPLSLAAYRQRFPPLEVSAFESYIRGLLAFSREQQVRYFLQAARSAPDFYQPAYQLGLLSFEDEDYGTAAEWLEKIPDSHPLGLDARFYLSLCHFFSQDVAAAAEVLAPVAERLSAPEVENNLGVFASRLGKDQAAVEHFHRALEAGTDDPDLYFNLGVHYLRRGTWEKAARAFQQCLGLNSGDTEARFLRAHALEKLGREQEAERARQQAVGDNPALALSLERRELDFDRIKDNFSARSVLFQRRQQQSPNGEGPRSRHVDIHIQRGEDLLARDDLEEARRQFTQAILIDPDAYRAHLLLAEVYERQGRLQEAVSELKASLWSQETVDARLRLAKIYASQNRRAEARAQVEAALALAPDNAEARALESRLASGEAGTGTERATPQ